jgi:hypothetical protein
MIEYDQTVFDLAEVNDLAALMIIDPLLQAALERR